jgi:homoserine kinase type II
MSVYTKVTEAQLADWLKAYSVGTLVELKGIASGIENTNYFVTTTHGRYVLTLFERLPAKDLPFYLGLMAHLARHGIPCPSPIADRQNRILSALNGKPAALVTRLPGATIEAPAPAHCAEVGAVLADMHIAGQSYPGALENPRGPRWWREAAREVLPFLEAPHARLLESELEFQSRFRGHDLERGPVHADLFRDNVLFEGARIGGVSTSSPAWTPGSSTSRSRSTTGASNRTVHSTARGRTRSSPPITRCGLSPWPSAAPGR